MDWTDERMDDLASRIDAGVNRTDRDIRDLRREMRGELGAVRQEIRHEVAAIRKEMRGEFATIRKEMRGRHGHPHETMLPGLLALVVGLLWVLASLVICVATVELVG